jgi:hypothetical protein
MKRNRKNSQITWREYLRASKKYAMKKWLDKKITARYNMAYWNGEMKHD